MSILNHLINNLDKKKALKSNVDEKEYITCLY